MRSSTSLAIGLTLTTAVVLAAAQSAPVKQDVEGIRNFTKVDATVACAGATDPTAIAGLKQLGYRSIVNLRLATEDGAAIDDSRAAAEAVRIRFIHLPFDGSAPDPKVADAFLAAVTDPANQPVFINCGSANRVGAMWLIKRMLVDHWDEARALEEAKLIGLRSDALQAFALKYVADHRGAR
ncbi:MAG: sulfur transferase domain-containing protein [Vicinamibacterales bacterium]